MAKRRKWRNSMTGQSCFIPKFLRMKHIIWLTGNIIPKFMQEFLLNISDHNLRMSNRAYVETKEPLLPIAPLRFKSAKLGVSEMLYSLVFNPHWLPLSVIPKISNCSGQYLSKKEIIWRNSIRKRHFNGIIIVVMIICCFSFQFFVFRETEIVNHSH